MLCYAKEKHVIKMITIMIIYNNAMLCYACSCDAGNASVDAGSQEL